MKRYPIAVPMVGPLEKKYVNDCLDTGWITWRGQYVEKFENAFAKLHRTRYAVSAANGTVTLHLILKALNIGPGDEVIIPTLTYVACLNSILYVGARPVFVDSDPKTWNMRARDVASKITKKTKAIMTVHLYGNPCELDELQRLARRHRITLFEDAAEALGATYHGRIVGGWGTAGSFSFFGNKTITTGEGGMIITNSRTLRDKVAVLKNHGQDPHRTYHHKVMGYNYRMTNIEAALGFAQLASFKKFVARKRSIASWYRRCLKQAETRSDISFQEETAGGRSSFWMFGLTLRNASPKRVAAALKKYGIETRPLFEPMHMLPFIRARGVSARGHFPVAEKLFKTGIILPSALTLSEKDVKFICNRLMEQLNK